MEYEYEAAMEKHYRNSLLKAFRKTVNDGYFPFIIVDCVNHQVKHFEEMWSYAKQKGFQVQYKVFCNHVRLAF
jgi:YLP motif-containing protein 1